MIRKRCWTGQIYHRWDKLLAEINRQLKAKNIIMSEGRINIIDATPIEAAQSGSANDKDGKPTKDPDAGWPVKNDSRGETSKIRKNKQTTNSPLNKRIMISIITADAL